jgi:hypothetical protein
VDPQQRLLLEVSGRLERAGIPRTVPGDSDGETSESRVKITRIPAGRRNVRDHHMATDGAQRCSGCPTPWTERSLCRHRHGLLSSLRCTWPVRVFEPAKELALAGE